MKLSMILSQAIIFLPIICAVLIYILNKKFFNYSVFLVQGILTAIVIKLWFIVLLEGDLDFSLGGMVQ